MRTISSGRRRRLPHQRQNHMDDSRVAMANSASSDTSQLTGMVQPPSDSA